MIEYYEKETYICDRCGKRKDRETHKLAPFSEVSIYLSNSRKILFYRSREHLCDDCKDDLVELLEAFFDDANKREEA
jgi:hypothetical protein